MEAPWVFACSTPIKVSHEQQPPRLVRWSFHPSSSCGPLMIGVTETGAVCRVEFGKGRSPATIVDEWQDEWPATSFVEDKKATAPIARILEDKAPNNATLKIALVGTDFQLSVWRMLLKIPAGKVLSYNEVARRIKNPRAARAVGTACGANPVAVLVPCHRVIASNGTLGGFGGGLPLKEKMLKAEKASWKKAA